MATNSVKHNSVEKVVSRVQSAMDAPPAWPENVPTAKDAQKQADIEAIFSMIMVTRPSNEWTGVDIHRSATLAQMLHLVSANTAILIDTGLMIKGERGMKPSPILHALEKTNSAVASLARQLGLTATNQAAGDPRTIQANRNEFQRTRGDVQDLQDNDLLARPN